MMTSVPPGVAHFDRARALPGSALDPGRPGLTIVLSRDDTMEDDAVPLPPLVDAGDLETIVACAKLEHNDTDNGRRMLLHFGRELLHVRENGWHGYTGRVWAREGGDEVVTGLAQRTAKRIHHEAGVIEHTAEELAAIRAAEALELADPMKPTPQEQAVIEAAQDARDALKSRRASIHAFAKNSGNGGKIKSMIEQALPHRSCGPRDLDADNMLFNCENTTLRFRKIVDPDSEGNQHETYRLKVTPLMHDRRHRITKMAPVVYDPDAKCPKFLKFIEKVQPIEEVRKFLQIYHGLALTGMTGQQCFVFNYGTGANGKSTFMEALRALFGPYGDLLNAESLTGQGQRRGDQATPDFAELPGVRYLCISELPRGEPLKEALVKALTGGEEIKARHLNKGFFKYQPVFKAVMSGNDLPSIGGVDNGIWRRVKLVVWGQTIPEEERRPMDEVLAEFEAERAGILNWLIEGLDLYFKEGLQTPPTVANETKAYREEMDPLGAFIEACVEKAEGEYVYARDMYNAFVDWCSANSVRAWKETAFGRAMPHKGIVRQMARVRKYLDVRLVNVPPRVGPRSPEGEKDGGA